MLYGKERRILCVRNPLMVLGDIVRFFEPVEYNQLRVTLDYRGFPLGL